LRALPLFWVDEDDTDAERKGSHGDGRAAKAALKRCPCPGAKGIADACGLLTPIQREATTTYSRATKTITPRIVDAAQPDPKSQTCSVRVRRGKSRDTPDHPNRTGRTKRSRTGHLSERSIKVALCAITEEWNAELYSGGSADRSREHGHRSRRLERREMRRAATAYQPARCWRIAKPGHQPAFKSKDGEAMFQR